MMACLMRTLLSFTVSYCRAICCFFTPASDYPSYPGRLTCKKNRRSDTCSRRIVLQLKNCITSRPLGKRCASYLVKFHQQRGLPATGDKTKNTRMLHTVLENVVRCTFLIVFSFYGCSFFRAGNGSKVCVCIACAASLPYMRQVRKKFS